MDRFVVGTGRCGSTLLSRMLALHPDVCSLFEFFTGLDWGARFAQDALDGAAFASLVGAEQPVVTAVLRRGYAVPEVTYPFERGGRHGRGDPLPWLLVSLLPRLTNHPDDWMDALLGFARERPTAALAEHYRALFDWLAARCGRPAWIERSGSSIDYLGDLARTFPEARFVHLHRDGGETALSMRAHHAYRLPISLLYDAPLDDGTLPSELGGIDLDAEPTVDDAVSRILASRPPAAFFGRYWSDQVVRGMLAARALPRHRYAELAFESLIDAPRAALTRLAHFFELDPDDGWLDRACGLLEGTPRARVPDLSAPERDALAAACAPGVRALRDRESPLA
jgi:hypothetical protein